MASTLEILILGLGWDMFLLPIAVSVDIQFAYTPKYPDEPPIVTVPSNVGLSELQVEQLEAHLNSLVCELCYYWHP